MSASGSLMCGRLKCNHVARGHVTQVSKGMAVTVLVSVRIAAGLAAASVLMAACANSHPSHGSVSAPVSSGPTVALTSQAPSPSSSHPESRPSQEEVVSAVTTLRQYLHAWVTEGPSQASRYLVTSERMTSDEGSPRISAGTVTSYRLYRWKGPREFTLFVSMNLKFTNNPMAWNRGRNDLLMTAHRVGHHHGYLLEFATSP